MVSTIPHQKAITSIQLMKNKLVLVAGKPYAHLAGQSIETIIKDTALIFREKGSATRLAMEKFISPYKSTHTKGMELTSNEAVKQAVIAGLGISIMPLIGIKNSLNMFELQILPQPNLPIETDWNMIWLKSKNHANTAKAFIAHLQAQKHSIIEEHFSWLDDY